MYRHVDPLDASVPELGAPAVFASDHDRLVAQLLVIRGRRQLERGRGRVWRSLGAGIGKQAGGDREVRVGSEPRVEKWQIRDEGNGADALAGAKRVSRRLAEGWCVSPARETVGSAGWTGGSGPKELTGRIAHRESFRSGKAHTADQAAVPGAVDGCI